MPSDTRPAITRRVAESARRTAATTTIAPARNRRSPVSPASIWSTARPVSHGIATVATMASAASTIETTAPARYGRRNPSRRRKVLTQLQDRRKGFLYLRGADVRRDRTPKPLRDGQGSLGREPSRRAVPVARRRHGRGEDRAPGTRPRRRDARSRDAGDGGAGRRRHVGAGARPPRHGPRQAARHPASRGPRAPESPAALTPDAAVRVRPEPGRARLRGLPRRPVEDQERVRVLAELEGGEEEVRTRDGVDPLRLRAVQRQRLRPRRS